MRTHVFDSQEHLDRLEPWFCMHPRRMEARKLLTSRLVSFITSSLPLFISTFMWCICMVPFLSFSHDTDFCLNGWRLMLSRTKDVSLWSPYLPRKPHHGSFQREAIIFELCGVEVNLISFTRQFLELKFVSSVFVSATISTTPTTHIISLHSTFITLNPQCSSLNITFLFQSHFCSTPKFNNNLLHLQLLQPRPRIPQHPLHLLTSIHQPFNLLPRSRLCQLQTQLVQFVHLSFYLLREDVERLNERIVVDIGW